MSSSSVTALGRVSGEERALLLREQLLERAPPRIASRTSAFDAFPFIDAEHTYPPGIASTSTPTARRATNVLGKLVRNDRSQLHDGVTRPALDPARADRDAALVERELGSVEEEHLPDLRLERIELEGGDRRSLLALRDGQLQLDAVRAAHERDAACASSSADSSVSRLRLGGHDCSLLRRSSESRIRVCPVSDLLWPVAARPGYAFTVALRRTSDAIHPDEPRTRAGRSRALLVAPVLGCGDDAEPVKPRPANAHHVVETGFGTRSCRGRPGRQAGRGLNGRSSSSPGCTTP